MISQYIATFNDGYSMMDGGSWGFGFVMMLFFTLAIVVVGFFVVRVAHGHGIGGINSSSAIDVAKMRYAKGEITKTEFEQLKKDIQ